MTFVIALPCVDVKDKACLDGCPMDCIHERERMLYLHPDECTDREGPSDGGDAAGPGHRLTRPGAGPSSGSCQSGARRRTPGRIRRGFYASLMLTSQVMPKRSVHMPKTSPHICLSSGTATVPLSDSAVQ